MTVFLTTDRMRLRQFTVADLDNLHALDADPAVMRLLTNGVPTPLPVIRDEILPGILRTYERSERHGRWAAEHLPTGDFLGWFSLDLPAGDPDQAELGYRLRRAAWGHGYATEGARALVHAAFSRLGLRRVYAETMAVNTASRRVLEKAGLRYVRTFHLEFDDPIPGTEHGEVEYSIERDTWLSARPPAEPAA